MRWKRPMDRESPLWRRACSNGKLMCPPSETRWSIWMRLDVNILIVILARGDAQRGYLPSPRHP